MTPKSVKVFAPASISNLGSGFDVLGLAIDKPGDYVIAQRQRQRGISFSVRSKESAVPLSARDNVASHVAQLMIDEIKPSFGIKMILQKLMPIGSGLGSSAASSVAAVVAVNALLPKPLQKYELLRFAVEGERKATGDAHADNAAPSLLGGVCIIRSYSPLDVVSIPVRNSIVWIVVHPHLVVGTKHARKMLPKSIPLRSGIRQWGNVAGLTVGLMNGDAALVGKCVEDVVAEPVRAKLIPGFYKVKKAALDAGACGCSISGSGPSIFAVAQSTESARKISAAMIKTFRQAAKVDCDAYISRVNMHGAKIVWAKSE
jgi:homoserine kinase